MKENKTVSEISVRINIEDIKPLNDLMEILCNNLDRLPEDIVDAVGKVVDYENGV